MPPPPSTSEEDCPECREQKVEAAARAKATPAEDDGLQLGDCAPLYKLWADCVEREEGKVQKCASVLKEFKQCHNARTERAMQQIPKR